MALQLRRGTNTQRQSVVFDEGELVYTTDTKSLYVGDGLTAGGTVIQGSGDGGTSNSFATIVVAGQSNVVADSSTDTLTLVAGTNVSITTNATNDSITINASGGATEIGQLTDVDTSTTPPNDGDALVWSQTAMAWIPDSVSGLNYSLNDLNDVDTATAPPTNGNVLVWNEINGNWVPGVGGGGSAITVYDETDELTTSLTSLRFEGAGVAATNTDGDVTITITGTGTSALGDLSDVDTSTTPPVDQDILKYDGVDNTWKNVPFTPVSMLNDLNDVDLETAGPGDGDVLVYDQLGAQWIPSTNGKVGYGGDTSLAWYDGAGREVSAAGELTWDAVGHILTSQGGFAGPLTGDVTGDLTGDVTGNLSGTTTGNHIGDVYANPGAKILEAGTNGTDAVFTGSVTGNVTGNVNGNLTGVVLSPGQINITSVGTLTGLTTQAKVNVVDNYQIVSQVYASTDGTRPNQITVVSTSRMAVGNLIKFRGAGSASNIVVGTSYYVKTIVDSTHFTMSTVNGGTVFAITATVSVSGISVMIDQQWAGIEIKSHALATDDQTDIFKITSSHYSTTNNSGGNVIDYTGAGLGESLRFNRSRGTVDSPRSVETGDVIFGQEYSGYVSPTDGSPGDYQPVALITVGVEGTVNRTPGSLVSPGFMSYTIQTESGTPITPLIIHGKKQTVEITNIENPGLFIESVNWISATATGTYSLSSTITTNHVLPNAGGYTLTLNMPTSPKDGQLCKFILATANATLALGTGAINTGDGFAGAQTAGFLRTYIWRDSYNLWFRIV